MCYGDWASENATSCDVIVEFLADFEREFEKQTVIVVVCAPVRAPALMRVDLGDGRHDDCEWVCV